MTLFKLIIQTAFFIVFLIGGTPFPYTAVGAPAFQLERARVRRVIDGDTIVTDEGVRIRYIGIDSPETHHPRRPVECLGKKATEVNRKLVDGKEIFLVKDRKYTDRYGRQLRYVFLKNSEGRPSLFVNKELVVRGLARARFYPPNVREKHSILEAERHARTFKLGIWRLPPSRPRGRSRLIVLADPFLKVFFRPETQRYENLRCQPYHLVFTSDAEAKKAGFREGVP